jgi:two-component system, NtrC family, sensor kinase
VSEPSALESAPADQTTDGLVLADRLAGLGTLVAGVAHEINNPITYVVGNLGELEGVLAAARDALERYRAELERLDPESGATLAEACERKLSEAGGFELADEVLDDALEGARRIRDLVRDLLSLSRGSPSRAPIQVHELLDFTLRMVRGQLARCAALRRDFRATRRVDGDRARLGQVFLNIVDNAIQAFPDPDPERHWLEVRTRDTERGLEIEFESNGAPIPAEVRPHIFAPFFTTKGPDDGTGLGLYISRRIAEDHGGTLEFESPESGGTLFRLRLPGERS